MRKYTLCFQTVLFLQLFHCTRSTNSSDSYSFTPSIWVLNFQTFLQHKKNVTSIHYYNRNNNNNNNTCAKATTITATTGDIVPPFTVAAIQITAVGLVNNDVHGYLDRAIEAVKQAAAKGATLILLPELFLGPYFCQSQDPIWMNIATKVTETNVILSTFQRLATNLSVVLPISIFEQFNNVMYNSVVMFDSDGQNLGTYRKSHIPDGTGYQEKFYFSPGDSGFKVFSTTVGRVGVGICWDQWFPETARSMALMGADVLLYPTAIGSEPQDPTLNSMLHWQRVMQGHAAANMVPVVASNRHGTEILLHPDGAERQRIHFYGKSFITDVTGAIIQEARDGMDILYSNIDIASNKAKRRAFGLFRDRRPELYQLLLTKDGQTTLPA